MKNYEVMFIVKPIGDDEVSKVIEKVERIIAERGKVEDKDLWGVKRLAYEIEGFNDGFYALISFVADVELVKELDRKLKLEENIMRYMIIRKGE